MVAMENACFEQNVDDLYHWLYGYSGIKTARFVDTELDTAIEVIVAIGSTIVSDLLCPPSIVDRINMISRLQQEPTASVVGKAGQLVNLVNELESMVSRCSKVVSQVRD
jgi:hypothetical protein